MRRRRHLALAITVVLALAAPAAASAHALLPDLAMAQLRDLTLERTGSQTLLRFTSIIVNKGDGGFEAHGSRTDTTSEMTVVQRIPDSTGGYTDRPTTARMYWSGDGHNHWHVRDLEDSSLTRLDNGVKAGAGAKRGFCFFDYEAFNLGLFGAPQSKVYTTCGTNPYALTQTMGLSIGWADRYSYYLVDQWIDITNVSAGNYRLQTTADAGNWFAETDETNNATWVEIALKKKGAPRILRYGPSA